MEKNEVKKEEWWPARRFQLRGKGERKKENGFRKENE